MFYLRLPVCLDYRLLNFLAAFGVNGVAYAVPFPVASSERRHGKEDTLPVVNQLDVADNEAVLDYDVGCRL